MNPFSGGSNIGGMHSSANSIAHTQSGRLSSLRSVSGNMGESDFRALSNKEAMAATQISKDEIEYEIYQAMDENEKEILDFISDNRQ